MTPPLGKLPRSAAGRLAQGAGYLVRGFKFPWVEHRGLLRFVAAPAIINTLLFVGLVTALWTWGGAWAGGLVDGALAAEHPSYLAPFVWLLRVFSWVFLAATTVIVGFVTIYLVGGVVAAPFNDVLSEHVEALRLGTPAPPFSLRTLLSDAAFSIGQELRRMLVLLLLYALALPLHFIPVIGTLLWGWIGLLILAMDMIDIPLARNRFTVRDRLRVVRANVLVCTGFGAACAALLWAPLLQFVCLPAAVVGGTLLYADLREAADADAPSTGEQSS